MKPNTTFARCTSTLDVRSLGVAITYPYMFANPAGNLTIARHWEAAFTLTCMVLDEFMGPDRRGFCWRQLDVDGTVPHWYWSLGREYDHHVLVTDLGVNTSVAIAKSAADPQDDLRNAVRALVDEGMRRAAFFSMEAGSPGARQ